MNRDTTLRRAAERREPWDLVVIGGGATGAGVAVDAAARGYSVLLVERDDFGAGTSSRSSKLAHGGVRYLRQGHVGLVREALRERGRLLRNAGHLVRDLAFVVPCYGRWERAFYGAGLTAYDFLAGRYRFGKSAVISAAQTRALLPTVRTDGLRGGVVYHDGQFDDARLLIHLVMTAADLGAVVLNYASAVGLSRGAREVIVRDSEAGVEFRATARVVVNAAGPFCDEVRRLAGPVTQPMMTVSQGSHIVLDRSFLPGDAALLVPKTPDKRVLFAMPWHGHTLVGTTDVALPEAPREPRPTAAEIRLMLETAGRYLQRPPETRDVLSTFAGIRPLVKAAGRRTAEVARDYALQADGHGLLTIAGGKWTTYRSMAEACVDRAAVLAGLPRRPCPTRDMPLHGPAPPTGGHLAIYGTDAADVKRLVDSDPALGEPIHPALPYIGAEVVWAARAEMARTVADVLARRTRALFLNASVAVAMAPKVATLLAGELQRDRAWESEQVRAFEHLAQGFRL